MVGGDLGEVAGSAVGGSIEAAGKVGGDTGKLATEAAVGGIKSADDIGSEAGSVVRKALLNSAALPKQIIEAAISGNPDPNKS